MEITTIVDDHGVLRTISFGLKVINNTLLCIGSLCLCIPTMDAAKVVFVNFRRSRMIDGYVSIASNINPTDCENVLKRIMNIILLSQVTIIKPFCVRNIQKDIRKTDNNIIYRSGFNII